VNNEYVSKIFVSMIPVIIVGFVLKDFVEDFFSGDNLAFVGFMLLITSALLALSYIKKSGNRDITYLDSLIIGVAQAIAVLPGISRSGSTIATGLIIGNKREVIARFSFLMVLVPIIGENFIELLKGEMSTNQNIGSMPLLIGFIAAFVSGLLACKWMISIVNKGKLIWFSAYCFIVAIVAIVIGYNLFGA